MSKKDMEIVEMMEPPGGMLELLKSPRLVKPFWLAKKLITTRIRTGGGGASLRRRMWVRRPWKREEILQHVM